MMSDFTKTVKVKLFVSPAQEILFRQMTEQYRRACNFVAQYIFYNGFELNFVKLNKKIYHSVREKFNLKSQLAQSVLRTVIGNYKVIEKQLLQSPHNFKDARGDWQSVNRTLEWLLKPIFFSRPQADLVRDRDYSFVQNGSLLSINTLDARTRVGFERKHFAEYLDGSWQLGTSKLVELKGKWYLHICATKTVEDFSKENVRHVVGIDRGLRFIAVTYDEKGETNFFNGVQILRKKRKFREVRRQLQSKGTKSAKRALRRISGREHRWMSDVNHCISKTLVDKYGANTLFVLENLAGISTKESNLNRDKKQKATLSSWAFFQLEFFLAYKAHEKQSEVLKVSAKFTSQRCPKCGTVRKENRCRKTHEYICQCGYRSNDDRVGAMNIQQLGTMWIGGEQRPRFEKKRLPSKSWKLNGRSQPPDDV